MSPEPMREASPLASKPKLGNHRAMQLRVRSGSLGSGLSLVGAGLPVIEPNAKWVGVALIVAGLLAFLFDVHIERSQVAVGEGQQTAREHIQNGLRRLRANWLPLALLTGFVALSPFALERFRPSSVPTPPKALLPARPKAKQVASSARTAPPIRDPSATQPASSAPAPAKPKPKPVPLPPVASPKAAAPPPSPVSPTESKPDTAAAATAEAAKVARAEALAKAESQIEVIRKHREDGDDLFKEMFDASSDERVRIAMAKIIAWDRRGGDLVLDYWGQKFLDYYVKENSQNDPYMQPHYQTLSVDFFFKRLAYLNLIRQRQLSLGALANSAREASRQAAASLPPSQSGTAPEKKP